MKQKIIEDDTPGLDRCAVVSRESMHPRYTTNNVRRLPNGAIERGPALCGPASAGTGDVTMRGAFDISSLAHTWFTKVMDRAGHVVFFTLTNGRSELTAGVPWQRRPYELMRRAKIRATGGVYWNGPCLVRQVRDMEIDSRFLLTRKDLPTVECEPSAKADEPCACILAEQAARRTKYEATERAFEEKMTGKERARDLELSERSAKAMADAIAPLIEKLSLSDAKPGKKKS